MKVLGAFRLWLLAVVTIVICSFAFASHAPRVAQRIAHLEALVKCPSCDDLSVAQSNAPAAVAIRHEIESRVRAGSSDTQILTSLQARYTGVVLLSPSTAGLGVLLWLVPTLLTTLGLGIFVRMVRRR